MLFVTISMCTNSECNHRNLLGVWDAAHLESLLLFSLMLIWIVGLAVIAISHPDVDVLMEQLARSVDWCRHLGRKISVTLQLTWHGLILKTAKLQSLILALTTGYIVILFSLSYFRRAYIMERFSAQQVVEPEIPDCYFDVIKAEYENYVQTAGYSDARKKGKQKDKHRGVFQSGNERAKPYNPMFYKYRRDARQLTKSEIQKILRSVRSISF